MSDSTERMRRMRERTKREAEEAEALEERVREARANALPAPKMLTDEKGVYRETTEAERAVLFAANQDRAGVYARWRSEAYRVGEVASPW